MAEEYEGKVVFVGVSNNDTVEDGRAYAEEFQVPYALAHAPHVWDLFDSPARPTTLIIDEEGETQGQIIGPVTYESLKAEIESVL